MRPSFLARLVNGPLFDPVVFLRLLNQRRAVLFDCGYISALANREILSIESIFISHTHMDHFMGLDQVLRVILHRTRPLHLYGPQGFIGKVVSKLGSYVWNLTRAYPLEIVIHEVTDHEILTCSARAADAFRPSSPVSALRQGSTVSSQDYYSVDAVVLDHNIPCLGFVIKEPFHINIKSERMAELGYKGGPWIGKLKGLILAGRMDDPIEVPTATGARRISAGELGGELVKTSEGQKIAYVTDISASTENVKRISEIAKGADILFIEAYYLFEREDEARRKAHLTAAQAGMIAKAVGASKVVAMHISPRYHDRIDEIMRELEER